MQLACNRVCLPFPLYLLSLTATIQHLHYPQIRPGAIQLHAEEAALLVLYEV